ncbi:MAG: DUF2892 domain-containing protein [Algoriphagus sp.]|uniref:YgaP family membrane protein n=1 Tax=Algoriphagus sp. TaxID=1872435 RepID=UPI0026190D78|nr:DUF2892 domain-containing protein [Algoriphagus sp.]MDG1277657.1 DUF2892 domain-containing protein [Algoriphagus sp.]
MRKNMGNADRTIRLVVAAVLVVLYFSGVISGTLGLIGIVVAAIFTLTTILGYCPLYSLIGVKTCKVREV